MLRRPGPAVSVGGMRATSPETYEPAPGSSAVVNEASLDLVQTLLVTATVWTAGFGLGLSAPVNAIIAPFLDLRYVTKVATLDVVLVPLAAWLLVTALLPNEGIGTGLLLVAFASAGPLGIKLTDIAGGDVAGAIGLVVVLELANLATVPIWSSLVGIADSTSVTLDILRTLIVLVLLPIGIGMAMTRFRPGAITGWERRLARLSSVGVAAIMAFVVARHLELLGDGLGLAALGTSGLVIAFALGAGWLLGGPRRERRVATSLVTGVRANAAAIALATTAFAGAPDVALGVIIASLASVLLSTCAATVLHGVTRARGAVV
jgi:bile acid:Na+ symporter, BASS family